MGVGREMCPQIAVQTSRPRTMGGGRFHTRADIEGLEIGDDILAADHVRWLGYRVEASDVDLLGINGVVDLDRGGV